MCPGWRNGGEWRKVCGYGLITPGILPTLEKFQWNNVRKQFEFLSHSVKPSEKPIVELMLSTTGTESKFGEEVPIMENIKSNSNSFQHLTKLSCRIDPFKIQFLVEYSAMWFSLPNNNQWICTNVSFTIRVQNIYFTFGGQTKKFHLLVSRLMVI